MAVNILKRRHVRNIGKEVSSAEVVNAVFLFGLEALSQRVAGNFRAI